MNEHDHDNPTKRGRLALLPHEWCFGAFLAVTWLRLAFRGGAALAWSFVFLGCLLGSAGVIAWAARQPTPWRWRVRLLYYPAAMGISFYAMEHALPLLGASKVDAMLLDWDRALLGETPAVSWESWLQPWLVDVSMAGYLFFFFYLIAGPGRYCLRNVALFRKCIVGLFTMYGLGFLGYTFFPAGGPHRWMTFKTPLQGPWILDWTLKTVNAGSNCVDVFPSIHFAATLYLLMFDWQHHRRRFWWALVPCLVLWFSTLYLRFHYFVDLLGGVVVALAGWFTVRWYERSALAQRINTEELTCRLPEQNATAAPLIAGLPPRRQ
jgi:membrane-associated phospholipid phosphatase